MAVPSVQILDLQVATNEPVRRSMIAAGQPLPMRTVFLGRKKPIARPQALRLEAFVDKLALSASPPPPSVDYSKKALASIRQVLGNDREGDCVIASTGHGEGVWTGNDAGTPTLSSDSEMLSEYHRICGPGDNGCNIESVLRVWKSSGIRIGGKVTKIDGYVACNPGNVDMTKLGIIIAGGGRIGFNVPAEWMGSGTYEGAVWRRPSRYSFVGGHDVRLLGYDSVGVQVATWGLIVTIAWEAWTDSRIVDELWYELSGSWYGADRVAPNLLDVSKLQAAFAMMDQGDLPDWEPTPVPPVPPSPPVPPTPPVPPVPPTPPEPPKKYVLAGTIKRGGLLGGTDTFTGLATPANETSFADEVDRLARAEAARRGVDFLLILQDLVALRAAVASRDVQAVIAALQKLAKDLGVGPRSVSYGSMNQDAMTVQWFNLIAACAQLAFDVKTGNTANYLADIQRIAAALGLSLV